ncbi:ABC transporter substrate-binding protein [Methanoregula sp.]|uniref:ABC transporter substrate-binding protein n=1 Tax=Methanoregula sp. TaxID=2052170 RepID=UPI003C75A438
MEKKKLLIIIGAGILVIATIGLYSLNGISNTQPATPATKNTTTITDMMGRNLVIPSPIKGVLATAPPTSIAVYILAPDKLMGVNIAPSAINGSVYMPEKYQELPNVGGWTMMTPNGNFESFIEMKPDIVFDAEWGVGNFSDQLVDRQEKFGSIPVVGVLNAYTINNFDPCIQFMGRVLGEDGQAASLEEFYHRMLSNVTTRVETIPENERVRVYYASGPDGLQTALKGSQHAELIEFAGGENVADFEIAPGAAFTQVSMEQVTTWNPDLIIVDDPGFYKTIYNDTLWLSINAVKNHRVYLVPQSPYKWFDGPPGLNQIIGIPWTAKVFYPDKFSDMDMPALTREFYSKFYHYNLTDNEVKTLLNP